MKVIYKTQKRKKKKKKRVTCFNCFHSSTYDANFEYKAPRGRVYCQKFLSVVQIGCARSCPEFKKYRRHKHAYLLQV